MSNRLKIALDVDGVLADVMSAWLARTNPGRLVPITTDDMDRWDFWDRLGIRRRDFYTELDDCWREWRSVPPTEQDLAGAVSSLCKLGRVDIVTARSADTNPFVKLWLDWQNIRYAGYVSVPYGAMKADLDYDIFIDDSPLNAEAFLKKGKPVVLYVQPWNACVREEREEEEAPRVYRISSLAQAAEVISSCGAGSSTAGHMGSDVR